MKGKTKKKKSSGDRPSPVEMHQPKQVMMERADGGYIVRDYNTGKTSVATSDKAAFEAAKKCLKIG